MMATATHLVATTQPSGIAPTVSAEAVAQFAAKTGNKTIAESATTGMQPLPDAALKP
jgi:hypothetical protein